MNLFDKYGNDKYLSIALRTIKFLSLFILSFAILYFLSYITSFDRFLSLFFAKVSYLFYKDYVDVSLKGISLYFKDFIVNIREICAGAYELIVFISLIFASFEKSIKYRLYGAIVFVFLFFLFNFFRIIFMISAIQHLDIFSLEILHGFFFKVGFFIFLAVFFYYFYDLD